MTKSLEMAKLFRSHPYMQLELVSPVGREDMVALRRITDSGVAIGYARIWISPSKSNYSPFVYAAGVRTDLKDAIVNLPADRILDTAEAISENGAIVGRAIVESTKEPRVFLLTPIGQ